MTNFFFHNVIARIERKTKRMPPKKNSATSTLASSFRLPFEINKDRIAELFKAIHNKPGFIVDFDDVWPVLNWSNRDNAKRKLKDSASKLESCFIEGYFPKHHPQR
jgi:hypothetical protein